MIHPRVLFLGDPAAATPWVGIAKKLARACYDLKIASKLYKLGSGVTIRVENIFPLGGTLAGISKVWIEATVSGIANFLVYPRDQSNIRGFYSEIQLAFRHPISLSDYATILGEPSFYNIAKLQLSGNQFFYKRVYDEEKEIFVLADNIAYSWLGSNVGDGGFPPTDWNDGYYIISNSGTGVKYIDAGGTSRTLLRAIYSEGVIFKAFPSADYPDLANSYISGFSIKDIEYLDSDEVTQTLTIYLVAFTFLSGTNIYDTEIHIYDSLWNELKSIKLFDWSSYLSKYLLHPVRFNHDATECVMLNFYSSAAFNDKVETAICTLEYEVDEDGNLTITENITRTTVNIRASRGPNIVPAVDTAITYPPGYTVTTTTTTYDDEYVYTTPQYPIAVNYNEENEMCFAYYSSVYTESFLYNLVAVSKTTNPGGTLVETSSVESSANEINSTGTFTFIDNEIILLNTYSSSTSQENSYDHLNNIESIVANEFETTNSQQTAKIMYIDVSLQFLIIAETSSTKSPCSPSITYTRNGSDCEFDFSGVDYEIQSSGYYKIYQKDRKPKTIATYSDTETHSASAQGTGFDIGESSETRDVTFSYNCDCGSTSSNDSVGYTVTRNDPLVFGNNVTSLTSFGVTIGWSSGTVYSGLTATPPSRSTSLLDWGVISIFGPEGYGLRNVNSGSYYSTNVMTRGPAYGESYSNFSYCVDQRIKFGLDYPWLLSFKLIHNFEVTQAPSEYLPANFTALGAWTNGGYVQDISQPGRFNEFLSESLLLGPIGLY